MFETLLGAEDAVISDELNHASIIDGVRLCKAQRFRYANSNMKDLEAKLREAQSARYRMIATDGVFSMDGSIAPLPAICDLAEKHDALVMVDDSHAVGFMGKRGRGSHEYHGVMDRVDVLTGTLGKALGGASGGYTSGRREIIELLRQRSRPYLFSNTLAPAIAAGFIKALELLSAATELRDKLEANARHFRQGMVSMGWNILPGEHPIIPIMLGEAPLAGRAAEAMLARTWTLLHFVIRWCRRARREFGSRFPRRIRGRTLSLRWPNSRRSNAKLEFKGDMLPMTKEPPNNDATGGIPSWSCRVPCRGVGALSYDNADV